MLRQGALPPVLSPSLQFLRDRLVRSTSCLCVCDQALPPTPTYLHRPTPNLPKQSLNSSLEAFWMSQTISGPLKTYSLYKSLPDRVGNLISLCVWKTLPMRLKASWRQSLSHICFTLLVNGGKCWACTWPVNMFQLNHLIRNTYFYFSCFCLLVIHWSWRGLNYFCPTLCKKNNV